MQGQGDGSASASNSSINQDQRQCQCIHEWLDQESPSSLISQMVQSGIGSENQRRAFVELMNQVDAELTARGIGFQRSNPETVNGQVGNRPSMEQQANVSGALTKLAEPEAADKNLPGANSSNPILISSGGSVLEDGDGERGTSSNGRLPSFKRRAPGDAPRQLLLGESSRSVQQAKVSKKDDVATHENNQSNVNHFGQLEAVTGVGMEAASVMNGNENVAGQITVLEAGIGGAPTVNHHQTSGLAGNEFVGYVMNQSSNVARNGIGNQSSIPARQAEIQRNIRMRRNPNLQDFIPASMLNSQVQPPSQRAMFFPFVNSRDQPVRIAPAPQFLQVPEPFQTQQSQVQVSGQGFTNSGATQPQQGNLGNNPRNVMFPAGFHQGNLPHAAANMNFANGNTNIAGNAATTAAASSSQDDSDSNLRISAVPIWYPHQAIRYSNRMLAVLRREENWGLQGDYRPAYAGFRVHNALELVHRCGGGLRFEDVMMLNRSVLLGLPEEEEDVHEDMRLDIDDMTYEELIALGDEIGNVSTGLREESIFANLRVRKYKSFKDEAPENREPCCICQEQYADGELVGKLDCGHDFHANCIKQWLMRKNQCPICKKIGLAGKQREH